uniref:Mediator complex subunit 18 n=1 Tax=Haemonchus contortus TaxID=6289 RepID=A0A7I4Z857_HAECO
FQIEVECLARPLIPTREMTKSYIT